MLSDFHICSSILLGFTTEEERKTRVHELVSPLNLKKTVSPTKKRAKAIQQAYYNLEGVLIEERSFIFH